MDPIGRLLENVRLNKELMNSLKQSTELINSNSLTTIMEGFTRDQGTIITNSLSFGKAEYIEEEKWYFILDFLLHVHQ